MGQQMAAPATTSQQDYTTTSANVSERPDSSFYLLRLTNDGEFNQFTANFTSSKFEFVSLSVPLFDNILPVFGTDIISINGNEYTLPAGLYTFGPDMVDQLNALTTSAEKTVWSFDTIRKRITVSTNDNTNFTLEQTTLSQLILGFAGDKLGASSYSADNLINFFPYSAIILNSDKFPRRIMYQDSLGNDQAASFLFTIDTFDYVSKTTLRLDKNSFYAGELFMPARQTLFPLKITVEVLFNDGETYLLPLSNTLTAELVIKAKG